MLRKKRRALRDGPAGIALALCLVCRLGDTLFWNCCVVPLVPMLVALILSSLCVSVINIARQTQTRSREDSLTFLQQEGWELVAGAVHYQIIP